MTSEVPPRPTTIDGAASVATALETAWGLEGYAEVMPLVREVDVSADERFQRLYNRFYVIRRNADWRAAYYGLFEETKREGDPDFERVIRALHERTGNIEASFASKMISTLDPDMPIWDSIVLRRLGLRPMSSSDPEARLADAVAVYGEIRAWYEGYLPTADAARNIRLFDGLVPAYTWLSPTKKIDFLLWGAR